MTRSEEELLTYACDRFEEGNYGEALEAFVLAYTKGIEQEEILKNIYLCYMDGNDREFRETYEKNMLRMGCSYEECVLDFIPCQKGEYFVFDKEKKIFSGKFSVQELQVAEADEYFQKIEFSAVALVLNWDWREYRHIFTEAKNRKLYGICHDAKRAASFAKIPELTEYMENIRIFATLKECREYFHRNTSVYLPLTMFGSEDEREALGQIFEEEHKYRLTPEGRNTGNVLLTIGIPTHDRGHLLLKRLENLRKLPYDAEIEFAISKNGTHYYQEEYKSVKNIRDARINYVGYNKELGMSKNWQNVIKISHGRFVMLLSDEDDVLLDALEHYLRFLSEHKECGIISPRTVNQRANIKADLYYKKGYEAFSKCFLWDNYISGMIYNRQLFVETDIAYWDENYPENGFYKPYPHLWWQALMSFKGDYARNSRTLVLEGESVSSEETKKYRDDNANEAGLADGGMDWEYPELPIPSTYQSRLEQFQGGIDLIKDYFEGNDELKLEAWRALLNKTLYLMDMVYKFFGYKADEYPDWIERTLSEALVALDKLGIDKKVQKNLTESMLGYVNNISERIS